MWGRLKRCEGGKGARLWVGQSQMSSEKGVREGGVIALGQRAV